MIDFARADLDDGRIFYKCVMNEFSIEKSCSCASIMIVNRKNYTPHLREKEMIGMQANSALNFLFGRIFLSGFKYRDRTSIIGDILDSINSDPRGKTKTSLMRDANLSLDQVNKYLTHLELSGVIRSGSPLDSQELARYRLTSKGLLLARDAAKWRYALMYRPRTI